MKLMAAATASFGCEPKNGWAMGNLVEGEWKPVYGGFFHRFPVRDSKNGNSRLPKSGDDVQCVLLAEKTRKGGWKARLVEREMVGPVTNSKDVPGTVKAGQVVTLRVGIISGDGKRIQFWWKG